MSADGLMSYYARPRAASEAVDGGRAARRIASRDATRGRLVDAWAMWKRSWDDRRRDAGSAEGAAGEPDSTLPAVMAEAGGAEEGSGVGRDAALSADYLECGGKTRKVVSLRLRRKSTSKRNSLLIGAQGLDAAGKGSAEREMEHVPGYGCFPRRKGSFGDSVGGRSTGSSPRREGGSPARRERRKEGKVSPARRAFGRVRSQLHSPVTRHAEGEPGRYLEYAAELDDDSFERLVEFAKQINYERNLEPPAESDVKEVPAEGNARGGAEIIGEIRLEDFADASSEEDFAFLDDAEEQLANAENLQRVSSRSLRMDSQKLTWIGNESEFAAFFAEVGLDDILLDSDAPAPSRADFEVGSDVLAEWESATRDHNALCGTWTNVPDLGTDIRALAASLDDGGGSPSPHKRSPIR